MKNGDIWLVDLSDAKGHEQRGMRPAIIIGGANGLILVVPLTSSMSSARFSHTYVISPSVHNRLDTESVALVFQIVTLDRDRFQHRFGAIEEHQRLAIVALIRDLLDLD
jgi:mRNA interferase MazF